MASRIAPHPHQGLARLLILEWKTDLVPPRDKAIWASVDDLNEALIFLNAEAIMKMGSGQFLENRQGGFYNCLNVHPIVVHLLGKLEGNDAEGKDAKGTDVEDKDLEIKEASYKIAPSKEMLRKCLKITTKCLKLRRSRCAKEERDTPHCFPAEISRWAWKRLDVDYTLLNGKRGVILKDDYGEKRRVAIGELFFYAEDYFGVEPDEGERLYFRCKEKDLLSGKWSLQEEGKKENKEKEDSFEVVEV